MSTDDKKIRATAIRHEAAAPFLRPKNLAGDTTPSWDAIKHALDYMERLHGRYDIIADLRCTNPLKTVEDIDGAIEKLVTTKADGVIGVTQLEDNHPARIKKIINDRIVDFCMPEPRDGNRQFLRPEAYIRNGSIYIIDRDVFASGIHFVGSDNMRPWYMPWDRSINIDTEFDFLVAEMVLRRRNDSSS